MAEDTGLYYFCTRLLLEAGATVDPGHWGSVIRATGPRHGRFFQEYVFEVVRRREFGHLPSRFDVCFAFESQSDAEAFRSDSREYLYGVRVAPGIKSHRLDMSWIDNLAAFRRLENFETVAVCYWRGEPRKGLWEILVEGQLTVEKRLTPIADDNWPANGTARDEAGSSPQSASQSSTDRRIDDKGREGVKSASLQAPATSEPTIPFTTGPLKDWPLCEEQIHTYFVEATRRRPEQAEMIAAIETRVVDALQAFYALVNSHQLQVSVPARDREAVQPVMSHLNQQFQQLWFSLFTDRLTRELALAEAEYLLSHGGD